MQGKALVMTLKRKLTWENTQVSWAEAFVFILKGEETVNHCLICLVIISSQAVTRPTTNGSSQSR